jgi:hypothetical protein
VAIRQLALFDAGWPPAERFPANSPFGTVRAQVLADLRASRRPLIVTGYTSLDTLIDFLAGGMDEPTANGLLHDVGKVIGLEPTR